MTPVENRRVAPVWTANGGRLAVDRPAGRVSRQGRAAVADPAEDVNQPPEDRLANLNRDRAAGAARPIAAS